MIIAFHWRIQFSVATYIKVLEESSFISDVQYSVSTVNDVKTLRFIFSSCCISELKLDVLDKKIIINKLGSTCHYFRGAGEQAHILEVLGDIRQSTFSTFRNI